MSGAGCDDGSYGCGSKFNRRGKPQVLVHDSTYQGNPFWNSGFLSHSHIWYTVPLHNHGCAPFAGTLVGLTGKLKRTITILGGSPYFKTHISGTERGNNQLVATRTDTRRLGKAKDGAGVQAFHRQTKQTTQQTKDTYK